MFKHLLFWLMALGCAQNLWALNYESEANFLTLADIHFDPFIACHYQIPCALIKKLEGLPANAWSSILEKEDVKPVTYGQDTNYPLLKSTLLAVKKSANENHVAFVLILGDFLSHQYRANYIKYTRNKNFSDYKTFVTKTFQFLNQQLKMTFPTTEIYPAVGNNDSYHGDYYIDVNGAFFQMLNQNWSSFLSPNQAQFQKTFSFAGYYSVSPPNVAGLKVIVLNSVLFSTLVRGKRVKEAASRELRWLKEELAAAQNNHQHVIIAMHIPTEIDFYITKRLKLFTLVGLWRQNEAHTFTLLLNQFAPLILGTFAGHIHADWFHLLTFKNSQSEIPIAGISAVSPIFGNNPGFSLYRFSLHTPKLTRYSTFFCPLNRSLQFQKEYQFDYIF